MASIPWPSDLCSGTAEWWLGFMSADTDEDDDRYPQLKAGKGIRVNFTPDVSNAVTYRGVEGNKTIMPLVSTGVIDDEGYLCTMNEDGSVGTRGVVLPSSECETLTPQDWTWTVTVTENSIRINRFSISLSPGEEIDLADYVPVDSSGGTHIVTEVETAERAEKAATQAGQYRQETKTDREATQRLRNEAESFRDAAGSSATSSAQSATTAGEILEQMQGMEITVDTSVGTRVFVGDTMIYGDTGQISIHNLLINGWKAGLRVQLVRENNTVKLLVQGGSNALDGYDATSTPVFIIPTGFRPSVGNYNHLGSLRNRDDRSNTVMVSNNRQDELIIPTGVQVDGEISWSTRDPWPSTIDF